MPVFTGGDCRPFSTALVAAHGYPHAQGAGSPSARYPRWYKAGSASRPRVDLIEILIAGHGGQLAEAGPVSLLRRGFRVGRYSYVKRCRASKQCVG